VVVRQSRIIEIIIGRWWDRDLDILFSSHWHYLECLLNKAVEWLAWTPRSPMVEMRHSSG